MRSKIGKCRPRGEVLSGQPIHLTSLTKTPAEPSLDCFSDQTIPLVLCRQLDSAQETLTKSSSSHVTGWLWSSIVHRAVLSFSKRCLFVLDPHELANGADHQALIRFGSQCSGARMGLTCDAEGARRSCRPSVGRCRWCGDCGNCTAPLPRL